MAKRSQNWARGFWVGLLKDSTFVVFDPETPNLYRPAPSMRHMHDEIMNQSSVNEMARLYLKYREMGYDHKGQVCLWIYPKKSREYFNRKNFKEQLSEYSMDRATVERVANGYLRWKLQGVGARNLDEYREIITEAKNRVKEIIEEPCCIDEDLYDDPWGSINDEIEDEGDDE